MGDLGAVPHGGVFQLHKVPHLHVPAHAAVGTDVGEGADLGPVVHGGRVELGGIHRHPVPNGAVGDHGVGADLTVPADDGLPLQDGAGEDAGAAAYADPGADVDAALVQKADRSSTQLRLQPGDGGVPGEVLGAVPGGGAAVQGQQAMEQTGPDAEHLALGPQAGEKVAAPLHRGAQRGGGDGVHAGVLALGQIPSAQPGRPLVIQKDRTGKHGHRAAQAGEKGGKTPVGVHRAGSDKLRPGGEAGLRRGAVIVVADHQKALRAGALQSRREPPGRRVEQDILQHEGGQIALPGQKYNRAQRFHKRDLPSHTGIRILYRIHYNKWPKALHRKLQKFFRKNGQKDRAFGKRRGQFHKCREDQAAAAALRRRRRRR